MSKWLMVGLRDAPDRFLCLVGKGVRSKKTSGAVEFHVVKDD